MKICLENLITVEQLAERLNVKIRTVYSWTSGRKIPYTRHRRRVYFDVGVVERILQRNIIEAFTVKPVQHSRWAQGGAQTEGEQPE